MRAKEDKIAALAEKLKKEDKLDEWPCPYCKEMFNHHGSRNIHIHKIHPGKQIPKMDADEVLARKRIYNQRYRAKLKTNGKTAGPRWPSLSPQYKREKYLKRTAEFHAMGLTAHGKPFKGTVKRAAGALSSKGQPYKLPPRAVAAIQRAQKLRRIRERRAANNSIDVEMPVHPTTRHKIAPIVYHAPFEVPVPECPHCKRKFPPGVTWREITE